MDIKPNFSSICCNWEWKHFTKIREILILQIRKSNCVNYALQSAVGFKAPSGWPANSCLSQFFPQSYKTPPSSTCYWAARLDYLMVPSQLGKWGSWVWKREIRRGGRGLCLVFGGSVGLNGLWRGVVVWESSESLWIFHGVGRGPLDHRQIGVKRKHTRMTNTMQGKNSYGP